MNTKNGESDLEQFVRMQREATAGAISRLNEAVETGHPLDKDTVGAILLSDLEPRMQVSLVARAYQAGVLPPELNHEGRFAQAQLERDSRPKP